MEPTAGTELMALMARTVVTAPTELIKATALMAATARTVVMVVTERTAATGEVQPSKPYSSRSC